MPKRGEETCSQLPCLKLTRTPTSQGLDQNKTNMVPSTQLALLYFFSSSRMVKKKKGTFIHHLTRLLAPINIYCRLWCQIIEIRMRPPGTSRNFSPFSILLPTRKKKYSYPFIRLILSLLLSIFILSGLLQELPLLNPPMPFILIPSFSITASLQPTSKLKSPFIKKNKK